MTIIILLISFAAYFNIFSNEFVIDDVHQIVENYWIRDIKFIPEIFSTSVWAFEGRDTSYYRPLMHIIYLVCYSLFGLKPWGFHLASILLHAGVSVLVFLVTRRLLMESRPSNSDAYLTPSFAAGFSSRECESINRYGLCSGA